MSGSNRARTPNQPEKDDHIVKLPGERTPWKTNVPFVDVKPPVTAHSRFDRRAWIVLLFSATILTIAAKISTDLSASSHRAAVVITILLWLCGVRGLIGLVALLRDSAKLLPTLTIDPDGFVDRRAGAGKISWSDISTVDISFGGAYGGFYESVHLGMRYPISVKRPPFRLGALRHLWQRSELTMIVPVLHMDIPAQRLVLLIVTLASTNGALHLLHPELLEISNPPSKPSAGHS